MSVDVIEQLKNRLYKPEKEIEILGHILNEKDSQTEILTELKGENFSDSTNAALFSMMKGLFETGHDITLDSAFHFIDIKAANATENERMKKRLQEVKLEKLSDSVFNSISLLKEMLKNRKIYNDIIIRGEIMFQDNTPIEEIVKHMSKILVTIDSNKKETPVDVVTDNVVDSIIDPSLTVPGKLTGLDEFDMLTGGVKEDRYYTIGGESGAGKTAVVIDLIDRLCDRHSEDIAMIFFSLEMSEKRVVRRLISRHANLTDQQLEGRLKTLNAEQKSAVKAAGLKIKNYPLEIVYQSMTCVDINLRLRKFALENPGKHLICFLDHIGLVSGETNDQRVNTIQASTTMKGFCRDYNGSAFVLTQFTKEIDSNENKKNYHKPHMGYIMESGRIRQDSDFVGLLWRPETRFKVIAYGGNEEWDTTGKMIWLNEKNRDGQCPTDMIFDHNVACNRLKNSTDIFN